MNVFLGGWATTGAIVIVAGVAVGSAPIVFVGAAIIGIRLVVERWPRRVLESLTYERTVTRSKTVVGDEVEVRLSLWNKTRLPIAWASAEDRVAFSLRLVPPGSEVEISGPLRPFERATRRIVVSPTRRGVHEIGPVRIGVAEHFGTHHPGIEKPADLATIIARPLMAPVFGATQPTAPLAQLRVHQSLFVDPTLFAGTRPYQAGDPARSIHWRASARVGSAQTKRFEPALSNQRILVLDVQTVEGPYWLLEYDEELFEDLCVAAVSMVREMVTSAVPCGFAAAGFSHTTQRFAYLPPRGDRAQVDRIGDLLARLSSESSAPLAELLAWLPNKVARGTTLTILSGRHPSSAAAVSRRLMQSGFPVQFVLFGSARPNTVDARRLGIPAWSAEVARQRGMPQAVTVNA